MPGSRLVVHAQQRNGGPLRSVLTSQTDAPYFPVPAHQVKAEVTFRELAEGARFEIHDARVETRPPQPSLRRHRLRGRRRRRPGGLRLGHRALRRHPVRRGVRAPPARRADLPPASREALRAMRAAVVGLCEGADLVIYDTMFTARGLPAGAALRALAPQRRHRDLARGAGARTLALYHHAPERSDDEIDRMLARRARAGRRAPGAAARGHRRLRGPGPALPGRRSGDALMEVTFYGVRGSIAAPGPGTVRYGGNTSCVLVRLAGGELIILDCGTGARNLGLACWAGHFGKGQGTRLHPAFPRPLGPHPGLPVLRPVLHRRQPLHRLRRRQHAGAAGRGARAARWRPSTSRCRPSRT